VILLVDNYDSFTYNLYQAIRGLGAECVVRRNDAISVKKMASMRPTKIVLSPGPGRPEDAGVMMKSLAAFAGKVPILGVCLGHQAIGLAFGGKVVGAKRLMHGKTCRIRHDGRGLYRGLAQNLTVMRYHSLIVEEKSLPACLVATARAEDGALMGVRHKTLPIEGVQFHPESVMTPQGEAMIRRFLDA
jgi:anthranilate synthase/aminodeoxychorismate synthase-like glutamine amidotransferase